MKNKILYLSMLSFIILSCSNDDTSTTIDDAPSIEDGRAETINALSNGDTKTWYISNAELVNENGTFNITSSYNVTDDDFIFKQNGDVQWNPGFDINYNATSAGDVAIDYYLKPITGTLTFIEESVDEFILFDGSITLRLEDDNTLMGSISFEARSAGGQLNITLAERTPESYASLIAEGLNFTTVTTDQSSGNFSLGAAGFIGSYTDNSLFIALRDDELHNGTTSPEVILKYNLNNNTWTENHFYQGDFLTKRLSIINNELIVFGASFTNRYPLQPTGVPSQSFQHNLYLTRFGMAVQGDLAYLTRYSFADTPPSPPAQILSYNYLTNNTSQIATLPTSRANAASEIINNKLYIFGGRPEFDAATYDAECFIVDLANGNISSFMMNDAPTVSYAAKFQNLIYVGYNYLDGDVQKIKFGAYNTITGNYSDVSDNLIDGNNFEISGMTVLYDFLYVIYRDSSIGSTEFFIKRAPIN